MRLEALCPGLVSVGFPPGWAFVYPSLLFSASLGAGPSANQQKAPLSGLEDL